MEILIAIILAIIASWIIAKACDKFEDSADFLGRNMTEGMKGATINAIGSSMPELLVTFIYLFVFMDTTGFAGGIGTTAGSAVFNALVIPALVIIFVFKKNKDAVIKVSKSVILRDGLFLIGAEVLLILLIGEKLDWYHGLILMLVYVSYAGFMIYRSKKNGDNETLDALVETTDEEENIAEDDEMSTKKAILGLIISITFISFACWLLVYACEQLGEAMKISGYFIAVIVAAAASSVPDTILSLKDADKGNYDDAVANALGSNIFDICFALGFPLFVYTIMNDPILLSSEVFNNVVELRLILLGLTVITFCLLLLTKKINMKTGIILLSMYVGFVTFVILKAAEVIKF